MGRGSGGKGGSSDERVWGTVERRYFVTSKLYKSNARFASQWIVSSDARLIFPSFFLPPFAATHSHVSFIQGIIIPCCPPPPRFHCRCPLLLRRWRPGVSAAGTQGR